LASGSDVKPVKQVNIYEAKAQLSHLVDQASRGESFIIAKAGTPVARLGPLQEGGRRKIKLGLMKGQIGISPAFDEPLPQELIATFEGGSLD
jgi:prevent-host-death family protein